MTKEEVRIIGDHELNLRVAKLVGFTNIVGDRLGGLEGTFRGMRRVEVERFVYDLNAMSRLERVVFTTGDQWDRYYHFLDEIAELEGVDARSASARSRVEAMVLALEEA